ncbi:MAG: hypothetical protein ACLRWQ_20840 [Flavonifractor plautii]
MTFEGSATISNKLEIPAGATLNVTGGDPDRKCCYRRQRHP